VFVAQGVAFGLGSAVGSGTMALFDAIRARAEREEAA